jgi:hypothetical protein
VKEALAKAFAELEEKTKSNSSTEPVRNVAKIEDCKQITQQNITGKAA